eukprot:4546168-Prymnesium_polylepis.1
MWEGEARLPQDSARHPVRHLPTPRRTCGCNFRHSNAQSVLKAYVNYLSPSVVLLWQRTALRRTIGACGLRSRFDRARRP